MRMKLLFLAIILLFVVTAANAQKNRSDAGALMYLGTYPNKVLVIDETQGQIIGEIATQTGIPTGLVLSQDKKKLYVATSKTGIEVVDLATRKIINHFTLSEGNRYVRVFGLAPDPQDRYLYATVRVAIKEIDRFNIEKAKFAVIDLNEKKITKTYDFPKEYDQGFGFMASYKVSPDGKLLYVFREDVLIFDLSNFKQVDKIELSKPLYPGMFPIRIGGGDDPNEEPGFVTSVFNATDPVVRRGIFGIARLNLTTKAVDFTPIGPSMPMMGFALTPDRKTGYSVAFFGQGGNRRTEFWVFDVTARKLIKKLEFPSRTRFSFAVGGNGKKLYIYGAGPTIETYDADTLTLQKTLTLDGDITTQLLVLRPRP